jgi:hypothetical protein
VTFAAPGLLLAGALAVALPILIHLLFRRRKRPVQWAAMAILREAIRRTERRRRIERWVLLALRCLLVACVAAAVAEPLWRSAGAASAGALGSLDAVIVLDDGVAQQCDSGGSTGLARAQAQALSILNGLGAGDRAALVLAGSTDAGPRRAVWPATSDLDRVREAVRSAAPTHLPSQMAAAIRMAAAREPDARDGETRRRRVIAVCSDHRVGSWGEAAQADAASAGEVPPELLAVTNEPVQDDPGNSAIVSLESLPRGPSTPEGAQAIRVAVSRSASAAALSLSQEVVVEAGIAASRAAVPWADGQRESSADASIQLPTAVDGDTGAGHAVSVSIAADDAQPADNVRHMVIDGGSALSVLVVDQVGDASAIDGVIEGDRGARWIERALRPVEDADVGVEMVDPASLTTKALRDADAAVVLRPDLLDDASTRALAGFVRAGGVVMVFPPAARMASSWADRMLSACGLGWSASKEPRDEPDGAGLAAEQPPSRLLSQLAPELRDLVGPVTVSRRHSIEVPPATGETLLAMRDGSALAASAQVGRGVLVMVAVAPEVSWSSMPVKPIMVPFMQEVIRQGAAIAASARSVRTGAMSIEPPSATFGGGQLRMTDGQSAVAVSPDGALSAPLMHPGCAEILDSSGRRIALCAVDIMPEWADPAPTDRATVERRIAAAVPAQVSVGPPTELSAAIAQWRGGSNAGTVVRPADAPVAGQGISLAWIAFALAIALALAEMAMGRAASHVGAAASIARRVA